MAVGKVNQGGSAWADNGVWKVNNLGSTLWINQPNPRNAGRPDLQGVAVDSEGSIVVVGYMYPYGSTATFEGITLSSLPSSSNAAFVWKLSPTGTTLWAACGGGAKHDKLYAVSIDSAGNIIAVGSTLSSPGTFGTTIFGFLVSESTSSPLFVLPVSHGSPQERSNTYAHPATRSFQCWWRHQAYVQCSP